jgi:hypothetical protein
VTVQPGPDQVRAAALAAGVCVRPIVSNVTDTDTGDTQVVPIACGSTRESQCPPCAERARRLRMHQCREGWHLTDEPERHAEGQAAEEVPVGEGGRRVRSTRRRQDVPDLPRLPVEERTVGRVFVAANGKRYRPSMFITHTLPSYGRVDGQGVPVDPDRYDYRRAALDAIHFPKLLDRYVQNLRRCAGYQVQYFAAIEAQRRGAPHVHLAARGAIPRRVVREVRAATYHQVWWPHHGEAVHVERLPVWTDAGYVDPGTGELLPTWDEALDAIDCDPDATPAHVVRFGTQDDIQGLVADEPDVDRRVRYLCKYLTKSIAGTHRDPEAPESPARRAHVDRLADEVRWLPCSPTCANWLRYGVQPENAGPGLVPGHCKGKAHDRENLGLGGRRVLVSRRWTGKTLAGHKADRATVVRVALREAGIDPDDHDQLAIVGSDGRWSWEVLGRHVDERTYAGAIATAICTRQRWRREYENAKAVGVAGIAARPSVERCGSVMTKGA